MKYHKSTLAIKANKNKKKVSQNALKENTN